MLAREIFPLCHPHLLALSQLPMCLLLVQTPARTEMTLTPAAPRVPFQSLVCSWELHLPPLWYSSHLEVALVQFL